MASEPINTSFIFMFSEVAEIIYFYSTTYPRLC